MGIKEQLQHQINEAQSKLQDLNRVPEDTFPFGTIVVFSSQDFKWYFVKTGEERWKRLDKIVAGGDRPLIEFVAHALESPIGYFEIYKLTVDETPIFASE